MSCYEGACHLKGMGVCGWARDKEGTSPLWVEALVDGVIMGIARADMTEPHGCGFWLPLPPQAFDGQEVQVRVVNHLVKIGKAILLSPHSLARASALEARKEAPLLGEVNVDKPLVLSGWVLNARMPELPLRITASVDGHIVETMLANSSRSLLEQGKGHGFVLQLPVALADGEEHAVIIQTENKQDIPGSPVIVRAWPENVAEWMSRTICSSDKGRALEVSLVRQMEINLPCAMADYAAWASSFPVPRPQGKIHCTWDFPAGLEHLADSQEAVSGKSGHGKGDYVFLLRDGETLHPLALAHMVRTQRETGAAIVYADSDRDGKPVFRPCFDLDRFWGMDYLGPLLVTRRLVESVPRQDDEGYCVWRVRLVQHALKHGGVKHLPYVLSHDLPLPPDTGREVAVADWVQALHPGTRVETSGGISRVYWPRHEEVSVTVIIPTRDRADLLRPCLKSLYRTSYRAMDILIVDNNTQDVAALRLLRAAAKQARTRVIIYPGVFNYAAMNNAAVHEATGEYICFLNNDTEAITPDWLAEMTAQLRAQGEQAGAVGAKLLWPNGLVQHAGVLVGTHQLASHMGNQWLVNEPGYLGCNLLVGQRSAVTAACLLTPKILFTSLGGFDARRFPVAFNDVDYCLRVRAVGKKIVWTPWAQLWHKESASRGADTSPMDQARMRREMRNFQQKWGGYDDPFYNPNLPLSTVSQPFEGLSLPPRQRGAR